MTTAFEELAEPASFAWVLAGVMALLFVAFASMFMTAAAGMSMSFAGVHAARLFANLDAVLDLLANFFANRHGHLLAALDRHAFADRVRHFDASRHRHAFLHADRNRLADCDWHSATNGVRNFADHFFLHHLANGHRNLSADLFHTGGLDRNALDDGLGNHRRDGVGFGSVDKLAFLEVSLANGLRAWSVAFDDIAGGITIFAADIGTVGPALAVDKRAASITGHVHLFHDRLGHHAINRVGNLAGFGHGNVLDHLGRDLASDFLFDHAGALHLLLDRMGLVASAGFRVVWFLANLDLPATALLAAGAGARIGVGAAFFVHQADGFFAGHANRFTNRFADLLADGLGFADRFADFLADRLVHAFFHLLAGGDAAFLVVRFAHRFADGLGAFLHFVNGLADLELAFAGLGFAVRAANDFRAFLIGRFADRFALGDGPHFRGLARLADSLLAFLVAGLVNDLVTGFLNLTVLNFVDRLVAGTGFVTIAGPRNVFHLDFFYRLIDGVIPFFANGFADGFIASMTMLKAGQSAAVATGNGGGTASAAVACPCRT